jgi:hypothetical protein
MMGAKPGGSDHKHGTAAVMGGGAPHLDRGSFFSIDEGAGPVALHEALTGARRPQTVGGETDWTKAAGADPKKQWENFQKFLVKKYGSLPRAFSIMDANGSGSLSCVEFQSVVCGVLRYCRASDAKRLFYAVLDEESQGGDDNKRGVEKKKGKDAGRGLITWKEFGISAQEWLHYCHEMRQQKQRRALRFVEKSRHQKAVEKHIHCQEDKTSRTDLAFGMPLPKGWVLPGTPADCRELDLEGIGKSWTPRMSAR